MRASIILTSALVCAISAPGLAQTAASPGPGGGAAAGSKTESQATVTMTQQNGSNESGMATLSQTPDGLVVEMQLTPASDAPQPAHIHKGSCAKLDPMPAFGLTSVTKGTDSQGQPKGVSTTTLKSVTLAQLSAGQYAINVHKSAADAKTYVACGDIKLANPTGTSQ